MSCTLADTKLVFEASGIEIIPFEIDYRSNRDRLDYAKVKITREAGEYLSDGPNFKENEPVRIEIDGHTVRRMCLPDSPVQLGVDYGYVTLTDPREILHRGKIDKVFHSTSLEDVLTYIFNNRDDPNGVLTGASVSDPDLAGVVTEDYQEKYSFWFTSAFGEDSGPDQFYEDIGLDSAMHEAFRFINDLTGILGAEGGFDFDAVTPAEALIQVEEQFDLKSWVDDDGVLWIGMPDVQADVFFAGVDGGLKIKSYNVTEDALPISAVKVSGTYTITVRGPHYQGPARAPRKKNLQSWAIARWTERSSGRIITENTKEIARGEDLALAAVRRLRAEIHDAKSGSLNLNPLASGEDFGHPTDLSVGDHIGVVGNIERDCRQKFESDLFVVNAVQHRISGDDGWQVTADVGKLVASDDLEVDFWYFDPTSQETLDPEEVYKISLEDD